MAAKALKGEDTATMPVQVMDDMQTYINQKTADDLNIKIPADVLKDATNLGE